MLRALTFLAASAALVSLTAAAQAPPALPEPVAAELRLAQEAYRAEVAAAGEGLLKEFAAEEKRVLDSTKLKIDDKIKRSEALQEEKKAFEADGKLPKALGLKVASAEYGAKVAAARGRCDKAFDKAAEAAGKTDLAAAKAVLGAKADFYKPAPPPAPPAAKPLPAAEGSNPLVGTWQRTSGKTTSHKHITPTHHVWVQYDATGRAVMTHGGRCTFKKDSYEESIDYGFGPAYESLKTTTIPVAWKIQGNKLTARPTFNGRTYEEVWELVGPATPANK